MINYFIRPGGVYVKINTDTEIVSLVLNIPTQKTLSVISNNPDYYNNTISSSAEWTVTNQETYNVNKTEVLNYITGSI
jgi:hypothetical protein